MLELFEGLQNQMKAQLNTNRDIINHPSSKGDSLENVWIEWLRKYLPNRYCVDKAFVIDCEGNLSDQIDLVIYDQQYTPFVFSQNGVHYIPAEGVYAVFEVKPDLKGSAAGSNYIKYAGKKVASVRRLKRTTTSIIDRGELKRPRSLTKIVGGILTSENTYSSFVTLTNHISELKGLETLDMGCAVEFGSFIVDYNGEEDTKINDFNERIIEYYINRDFSGMKTSKKSVSLITFFLQLSRYLQQSIGTVAAIDFNEYAKNIDFIIDKNI